MERIVLYNRESKSSWMDISEAWRSLRQAGFADREISKLFELRRAYRTGQASSEVAVLRCLQFVRWLVQTGRLTEMVIREDGWACEGI